jgi:hypothetical protein
LISRGAVLPVGAVRISMMSGWDRIARRNLDGGGAEEGSRPGPEAVQRSSMTLNERPRWGCLQFPGAPRVQHLCRPTTLAWYLISRYVLPSERCVFSDYFRICGLMRVSRLLYPRENVLELRQSCNFPVVRTLGAWECRR